MATYYDYQRRDPNTEVNWAEVGANFSNIIKEEHRVREERKEAINESTRQQQIQFDTAVMGDSSNMNNWTLDYADKGTKQLQMLDRLLQSGDMKIKDFTNSRQNLSDGTEQLFDLAAGYQSEFKKKMARADCTDPSGVGCSSQIETDLMASVEGFGNFANSEALIDPQTSRVMVGFSKYNEDKKIWELDEDPNSLVGINSLNNRIKQEFNLYDMDSAVAAKKESTGKFEMMVKQTGTLQEKGLLLKYSDPRMRSKENIDAQIAAGYLTEADRKFLEAWEADTDVWLDGELAKPNAVSSLLTNNLANVSGQRYNFTFDEKAAAADKTGYTVLIRNKDDMVVYDWTTENGKIQYDRAKEGLRTVLNGAMDHTVDTTVVSDATQPRAETAVEAKNSKEKKSYTNAQQSWNSMYGLSAEERNTILGTLLNSKKATDTSLIGASLAPDGSAIEFKYTDESLNQTITIPENVSQQQWAQIGLAITGIEDPSEALNAGGFGEGYVEFDVNEQVGAQRKGRDSQYDAEFVSYISTDLTSTVNLSHEQDTVRDEILNGPLGELGFKAVSVGNIGNDEVRVSFPGFGEKFNLDMDFSSDENKAEEVDKFEEWIAKALKGIRGELAKKNKWTGGNSVPSSRSGVPRIK